MVCCMLTCWNTTDISFYYDGHHLQAALAAMILLKEILGWGDFIGIIFIMAALLCNELWGKGSQKSKVCQLTTTQGSSQARRDEMQDLIAAPKIPWSECPKTSSVVRNWWGMFLKNLRLQWNKRTMQAPMSVRWQCKGAAWGPWGCHRANQCELSRQDTHSYLASWMDFQWKFAAPGMRGARKPMRRKAAETDRTRFNLGEIMQVIGATEVNETNPSIHINRCMISSNSRTSKHWLQSSWDLLSAEAWIKKTIGCHLGVRNVRGSPMRRTANGTMCL